jgi:hypothetical protein
VSGSIIRAERAGHFTVVRNSTLRDSRLSFAARGLLAYLLSHPDDWRVSTLDLINKSPAGRDAVHSILKELKKHGYLRRKRVQGERGKIVWETVVYEMPPSGNEPCTASPSMDEPSTVCPSTANPHTTKDRINESLKDESSSARPSVSRKARDEKDPRSKHPAIQAVKALTSRYPDKVLWDELIALVGDAPDVARLNACRKAWVRAGYNPNSLVWVLEWYAEGVPERSNKDASNGRSQKGGGHDHAETGGRPASRNERRVNELKRQDADTILGPARASVLD